MWSAGWLYYSPEREQVFRYQQQELRYFGPVDGLEIDCGHEGDFGGERTREQDRREKDTWQMGGGRSVVFGIKGTAMAWARRGVVRADLPLGAGGK